MSIKAMNWAMEQATGDPRAQCLLYVIADCANEEGVAWPGADWMATKSQQSRATVYRRLEMLQASGLLVMFPRWIDDAGKIWNAAATGRRRTSPEIRLQFGVIIKQIVPQEDAETEPESAPPLSQPETALSQPSDSPISLARQGSSHCSDNNHHLNQEDSPPTPSGGSVAPEGWKDFEDDWVEPILRQSMAQQVWSALKPEERLLARQAARGYVVWRKQQKKPPNVLGAHLFLKERDAWEKFARLAPDTAGTSIGGTYAIDSREGRALLALYAVARTRPAENRNGLAYRGEITPQILAFADVDPRRIWIEDRQQIAAWSRFLGATVLHPNRPPLIETRGIGADTRRGIYAPELWPPPKDGNWSTAGPDDDLSDQELADFK